MITEITMRNTGGRRRVTFMLYGVGAGAHAVGAYMPGLAVSGAAYGAGGGPYEDGGAVGGANGDGGDGGAGGAEGGGIFATVADAAPTDDAANASPQFVQ
jgi:hypothetical protein